MSTLTMVCNSLTMFLKIVIRRVMNNHLLLSMIMNMTNKKTLKTAQDKKESKS